MTDTAQLLLESRDRSIRAHVTKAQKHVLYLDFAHGDRMEQPCEFHSAHIELNGRKIALGRARYYPHNSHPLRRTDDPKELAGDGVLTTLDELFDFDRLLSRGEVGSLLQQLEQLPLVWQRRSGIMPEFAGLIAETIYDLNALRASFDDVDRDLQETDPRIANAVRETVVRTRYADFETLFDDKLARLQTLVAPFSQAQHQQHGFYLRKQAWDLILSSAFLHRTNLKPRGYAGDSEVMRMIYEQAMVGPTIFSRFLHIHPLKTAAAQAVRNRINLLGDRIRKTVEERGAGTRVMSVACGPARELRHALNDSRLVQMVELTLVDQDPLALAEAAAEIQLVHNRFGLRPAVHYEQQSVRRMLAAPDVDARLGRQHLIYAMGLFDYLTTPVARAVLAALYRMLEPGGELIVGNYSLDNPTRVYMNYWMDWVLNERSSAELTDLCTGLQGASVSIMSEDTASQLFLQVRRER